MRTRLAATGPGVNRVDGSIDVDFGDWGAMAGRACLATMFRYPRARIGEVLEGLLAGLVPALRDFGLGGNGREITGQRRRLDLEWPVGGMRVRRPRQTLLHRPDRWAGANEHFGRREYVWRDTATK